MACSSVHPVVIGDVIFLRNKLLMFLRLFPKDNTIFLMGQKKEKNFYENIYN